MILVPFPHVKKIFLTARPPAVSLISSGKTTLIFLGPCALLFFLQGFNLGEPIGLLEYRDEQKDWFKFKQDRDWQEVNDCLESIGVEAEPKREPVDRLELPTMLEPREGFCKRGRRQGSEPH